MTRLLVLVLTLSLLLISSALATPPTQVGKLKPTLAQEHGLQVVQLKSGTRYLRRVKGTAHLWRKDGNSWVKQDSSLVLSPGKRVKGRYQTQQVFVTEQAVRLRAYSIWEAAGKPHGRDKDHYFQALNALIAGR